MAHALFLFAFAITTTSAQFGGSCDGQTYPDVAALASQYPPLNQIATIVPGDTHARALFDSITGTALASPPTTLAGEAPSFAGYDTAADPLCWWTASQCVDTNIPNLPSDAHSCEAPYTLSLSFDDGPTCFHGPLYAALRQNNHQASLFYIGSNVANLPAAAKYGFEEGHQLCVHSWSHHYLTSMTNEQVFAELYYTKKIIKQITGVSTRCYRAPYGDTNDRVRQIAMALELYTYNWSSDTNDWQGAGDYPEILADDYSRVGTQMLAHEVSENAVRLFLQNYPALRSTFRNGIVSHGTCLNITAMYAEYDAPLSQTLEEYIARPILQELTAPAVANRTAEPFFAGQAAFLASLDGTNLPRPGIISSSSAVPSSTSSRPGASGPTTPTGAPAAKPKDKVEGGIIAGAVAGACGLAIVVALLFFCARSRGYCGGRRRTREDIYGETSMGRHGDAEMRYSDKHASYNSEAALLGTPLGQRDSRYSVVSESDLNSSRYPSVSTFKLPNSPLGTPLYQDETPPMSPRHSGRLSGSLPPGARIGRDSYFPPGAAVAAAGPPMTPPARVTSGSASYQSVPQQITSPE